MFEQSVYFDGSNDGNREDLLLVGTLVSNDGKVIDSDEDIKMGSTGCKVLVTIVVY